MKTPDDALTLLFIVLPWLAGTVLAKGFWLTATAVFSHHTHGTWWLSAHWWRLGGLVHNAMCTAKTRLIQALI